MALAVTLNDIQKRLDGNNSFAPIIEVLKQSNPIMEDIPFAEGDLPIGNKTTIRTSLPSPSIRRYNQGVSPTKSGTKQIIDVCMNLEDRSSVDVELMRGKPNPEAYRASEDDAHVEGMGQYVAKQLIYGSLASDPDTFNGIMTRYNTLAGDKGTYGYQTISAGTANTGNLNTSLIFVDWGDRKVTGIYPKGMTAGLNTQDLGENDVIDDKGKPYRALQTLYNWKVGLAVENVRSIVRVCNINTATLATLTSTQSKALIDMFIKAKNRLQFMKNPVCYCSESMKTFMECYLNDKNNVHITRQDIQDAPPLLRFSGIPVKQLDCMVDTESAVE